MKKVVFSLNSLVIHVTKINYIPFHQTGHAIALNSTSTRIYVYLVLNVILKFIFNVSLLDLD